jgi:hypothetical protein
MRYLKSRIPQGLGFWTEICIKVRRSSCSGQTQCHTLTSHPYAELPTFYAGYHQELTSLIAGIITLFSIFYQNIGTFSVFLEVSFCIPNGTIEGNFGSFQDYFQNFSEKQD